jgi:cation diffusion facilitator family transporter
VTPPTNDHRSTTPLETNGGQPGPIETVGPTAAKPDASQTLVTVLVAFASNLAVAIAKTIAATITGSPAMLAETAHSWADTGNEIFLLIAERRAGRPADKAHPQGYGREAYVWSMFAAFGLFSVGAAVAIWHGIQTLLKPEHTSGYLIAYIVLAISALFEGTSFLQSVRQARATAAQRNRSVLAFVFHGSNPTLRAVFAEDAAALIGLSIAFLGLLLHQLTGNPAYDAIGSILVGTLLAVIAVILIDRNRRFLLGQAVDEATTDTVLRSLLESPSIERVTYLHLEFVGPAQVYLVAAVDLTGDDPESALAPRLRAVEKAIQTEPFVQEAILTLSLPTDPPLRPAAARGPRPAPPING